MKKIIKTAAVGLALASGIALLPSMGVAHSNGGGWASATSVTIFYASSGHRDDATAVGGNLSTAEAAGNAASGAKGGGSASVSRWGTSVKGGGGASACAGSGCN